MVNWMAWVLLGLFVILLILICRKSVARWSILLSILALLVSVYATCRSDKAYEETTRPHTQFEEIEMTLDRTEKRLNSVETDVTPEKQQIFNEAKRFYALAESEHMQRHFDKAKEYLSTCNELIDRIALPAAPAPTSVWMWILGPLLMVVLIAAIAVLAKRLL